MKSLDKNNDTKVEKISEDDKTEIINDETDVTEYDLKKRKKQFIKFCEQKRSLKKVRPGRLKLKSEKGEQYASIQCKTGDCPEKDEEGNITTERNELWLENENGEGKNDGGFEFNKPYSYKFSFKIPENFPLSPTRLVIGQWKYNKIEGSDEEEDPSPILAQRIKRIKGKDGKYKYYFVITDGTEEKNILGKIPFEVIRGKWVDMDYELRFSDRKDKKYENSKPIPCTAKIKAKIEGKGEKEIYNGKFNIAEENNLQFNSEQSHTGYFKFGLYRDNYDYAKRKIEDEEGLNEIEKAQKTEEKTPMKIHFKNFSMEDLSRKEFEHLSYDKIEQEKQQSKSEQQSWLKKLMTKFKHQS